MNARRLWSRILTIIGGIAMLLGILDPLEGSMLILPGSGVVALGMFLGRKDRRTILYWTWVFLLIGVGVGAMLALSAAGGIGGSSGHSMWWGNPDSAVSGGLDYGVGRGSLRFGSILRGEDG